MCEYFKGLGRKASFTDWPNDKAVSRAASDTPGRPWTIPNLTDYSLLEKE